MDYYKLLETLQKKFEMKSLLCADSPKIRDIQALRSSENLWKPDVLYIGNSVLAQVPPSEPIMLLSSEESCHLPAGSNYSQIRKQDTDAIFAMAKDLIFEELQIKAILLELAQAALSGKNVIELMNSAATLMENALILIDLNFRILAHSTTHEIADPIWSETIENGSLSYEFVQKIRSSNEMKEWGKHRNKTQIFSLRDEPTLVAGIAKNGHVMGGIIMLADYSKINHRHLQLIAPIGTLLFDAFHYDSSHELYSSYNRILYNLLDESDLHTTLELIEMSKSNFPPEMQVVVARFILRNETSYIKNTIKKDLPPWVRITIQKLYYHCCSAHLCRTEDKTERIGSA